METWQYDKETGMVESKTANFKGEYAHICDLRQDFQGRFEDRDGFLLAASHDLLTACEGLLSIFDRYTCVGMKEADMARKAIAKARGAK